MRAVAGAQAPAALDGSAVRAYLDRLEAHPAVRAGTERALGPRGFPALADAFQADAAAARAAQPRRPIPGAPRARSQTGRDSRSFAHIWTAWLPSVSPMLDDHAFASHTCMHGFPSAVNSEQ